MPQPNVVFLHGLESSVDTNGVPVGRKARYLSAAFGASLPALDTRAAQSVAHHEVEHKGAWVYPFDGYEQAFEIPLQRARAAITSETDVVVASSFGGAVAMRLLHEGGWHGPTVLLASAGTKLTPYRKLPDIPALVVHGRRDTVVDPQDSIALVEASPSAKLLLVDDDHRLSLTIDDKHLGAWIQHLTLKPTSSRP